MDRRGSCTPIDLETLELLLLRERERERLDFYPLFSALTPSSFCIITSTLQKYLGINNELSEIHTLYSVVTFTLSESHSKKVPIPRSSRSSCASHYVLCFIDLFYMILSFYFMLGTVPVYSVIQYEFYKIVLTLFENCIGSYASCVQMSVTSMAPHPI